MNTPGPEPASRKGEIGRGDRTICGKPWERAGTSRGPDHRDTLELIANLAVAMRKYVSFHRLFHSISKLSKNARRGTAPNIV
jgi:hypothetical protein